MLYMHPTIIADMDKAEADALRKLVKLQQERIKLLEDAIAYYEKRYGPLR